MTDCTIYARFSPRRLTDECESIETQEEYCREYAQQQGYRVRAMHVDRAKSGNDVDREGLWNAVDELQRGEVLLCYRLDRLVRGVELSEVIFREVAKRGGVVEVVQGAAIDDSPEGRMIRRIMAVIADYEREIIGIRTKYAMKRAQRQGRRMSSQLPYGYCEDDGSEINDAGQFTLMLEDEHEQAVLARMMELRAGGNGATVIARTLTSEGLLARGGREWSRQCVSHILAKHLTEQMEIDK